MLKKMIYYVIAIFLIYLVGLGISYGAWTDQTSITSKIRVGTMEFVFYNQDKEEKKATYTQVISDNGRQLIIEGLDLSELLFETEEKKKQKILEVPFSIVAKSKEQGILLPKLANENEQEDWEKIEAIRGEKVELSLLYQKDTTKSSEEFKNKLLPMEIILEYRYVLEEKKEVTKEGVPILNGTLYLKYDRPYVLEKLCKEREVLNFVGKSLVKQQKIQEKKEETQQPQAEVGLTVVADYVISIPIRLEQPR